jgi:hypothetical protein
MSDKTIKRLVWLLGLALAIYVTLTVVTRLGRAGGDADSGVATALSGIAHDAIRMVRVEGPADTVRLQRAQGTWTVNGYDADTAAVDRLLRALETTEVGPVTATNPDNHERMGVAGADARRLTIEADGDSTTLLLGNAGTRFGTSYARLPDDNAVVTLIGELRSVALRSLDQWRDKTVLRLDTTEVSAVVVASSSDPYRLERHEGRWMVDGSPADSAAVSQMLGELASLDATGFAPDTARMDSEAVETITLMDEAGTTLAALRTLNLDQTLRIQRAGRETIYTLPSWRAERLRPDGATLRLAPESEG